MKSLKNSLPVRTVRNRHDNAVWWWQQRKVRRAIEAAFEAAAPRTLDLDVVLDGSWPDSADPRPVVLAACDEAYFQRFAPTLIDSCRRHSPGTRVHLHLYAPSDMARARLARLLGEHDGWVSASTESLARCPFDQPTSFFYAAGRFAVASRLRRTIAAPILMVDVDSLVVNDLGPAFEQLDGLDAAFLFQPRQGPRYRRVRAGAVYLGTGDRSDDFFTRLADGISLALADAGRFHVDQIGMHFALEWCRRHGCLPRSAALDLRWSDYLFDRTSFIWTAKGARKLVYDALAQSLAQPVQATAASPFQPR